MQRNCIKKYVSNTEKNAANKDFVFQHMSSHYRRIINAKKIVDTSPPSCYKPRRFNNKNTVGSTESIRSSKSKQNFNSRNISPALTQRSLSTNSYKGSSWGTESGVGSSRYHSGCVPQTIKSHAGTKYVCFDMGLVDLITYDTKNSPEVYCNRGWAEVKVQHNDPRFKLSTDGGKQKSTLQSCKIVKPQYQSKQKEPKEKCKFSIQLHNKSSPEISVGNSPKSPKNKSENRRHEYNTKNTDANLQKNVSSTKEQSQTSSRDSAYNGGISSLPESRSPTPDQRLMEEKYFVEEDPYFHPTNNKNYQTKKKNETSKNTKNENFTQENGKNLQTPRDTLDCEWQNENELKKMKEDGLYIKFIQDITVEILEKCLYTNKSLKKVMRRHILANLENLDKERMIKEVEHLRIQLGIPEDKAIFDVEKDVIDSFSDLASLYSFISDSEFILPEDIKVLKGVELNQSKDNETDDIDTEISKSTVTAPNSDEGQKQIHHLRDEKNYTSFSLESDDDEILPYIQSITKSKKKNGKKSIADYINITSSSDETIKSPQKIRQSKLRGQNEKDRKENSPCSSSSDIEENILEESADEVSCEKPVETESPITIENFSLKGTPDELCNANIIKNCSFKKCKNPCCNNCIQIQKNISHRTVRATYKTTITKSLPK